MRNYKQVNIMRVLKEERWALVRTVTAICITAMALICLVLAAGCTNDLTEITENRGTGETLALGTLTTKDANAAHATTRADSPLPDATAWQGFCSGDQLHVAIAAGEGSIFTRSSGIYEYTAAGNIPGSGSWTASTPAYWQRANGNILTLWRGPDCDTATPGAYDMPLTYETDVIQGHALNAWDGNTYTNDADKWRIMDLLRYCSADADLPTAATGMPATGSPLNLILKHSMAQLCVELLPGEGMTAQELQAQVTVHLKSAAATFTIQTDGRPAIYNFENEQNRQDVRLLKNGATSLKFYALMLPGQTFGTNRAMISLHIGDTHFTYTPGTPLTTTENTCHKLVLQVNRTEVSALSVTSTGWQDPTVITQPDEAEAEVILVINETPGTLKDNATLLNALKDATQESPVGLIITGKINDKDLEDLSSLMKYKDGDTNKFKVSSLAIYATGGTTLPHYFASNNPNPNPALKKIILPEGITDTGQISFYNCTALTDVTLPDGLTIINRNAFRSCNALKSIKLPDNLESIEKQAFGFCIALESIDVPNKTKDIGEQAFLVCSGLTSLMIGDGMINIGKEAFLNDTQLQSVTIQSAQAIGEYAFFGCSSLSDVTIDHVKNIGESAFSGCTSLSNLNIKGTESIGGNAFKNCTSLASITLPQTITGIGTFAFAGSGLTSITIPGSMKQISDEAFNGCTALKTATLEEGVETIGKNAFTNCKELTDITIPSTVTSIGNYAFNICPKLATVTFAGETPQLNSLGQNAFQSCEALTSIDIPDNVTTLATRTFNLCTTLENVTLPNQLESIGDFVFNECSALKKLDIPQNVTSIGGNAFNKCGELTTVNFLGQVPQLNSIGKHAFYECQKLADLTLPDRLTSIGKSAFYRCNALTSIRIPDNVVTIATKVFQECSGLATVVLPKNLENIEDFAFNNCSALANFVYTGSALPAPTVSATAYFGSDRLKYLFLPNYTSTITGTSLNWADITWKNIHYNANAGTDMGTIDALMNINNYQNHITQ
jgi:hypothetical protein